MLKQPGMSKEKISCHGYKIFIHKVEGTEDKEDNYAFMVAGLSFTDSACNWKFVCTEPKAFKLICNCT